MADWMEQQISDADDGDDTEVSPKSQEEFTNQIRTMLATGSIEKLSVSLLQERVSEVDDVEALEEALDADSRSGAQDEYQNRLDELGVETEEDGDGESEGGPEGVDGSEQANVNPPETEKDEDNTGEKSETTEATSPFADEPETSDQSESDDSPDVDGSPDESANTPTESETQETSDTTPDQTETVSDGGTATETEIDVKSIAPDVVTASEAAERDPRYTMLVWADPGQGKTHFACSGPEPVVVIDTEGKADEVAQKFQGEGEVTESPFIFQPTNYDEAMDALDKALDILDEYRTKLGLTGTLVVDSMSVMWGWSQQKYVEKFYPGKDAEEVEFNSAIGGGQSDWKQIKRYHNVKFRQVMLDSPYHLIWTAMREDDYEEQMKGNRDADKPAGEKENPYKVDEVFRIQEGADGAPVGVLNKSGKIKHRYSGLRYPTFDKHQDLIETILDAESGSRSVSAVQGETGVQIHEGTPKFKKDDDE